MSTTPRTWVVGEVVTAAMLNTEIRAQFADLLGRFLFAIKTVDEPVTSSTVLQNDDHLFVTLPTTGTYKIDAHLFTGLNTDNAADIAIGFSFPTGTMHFSAVGAHNGITAGSAAQTEWIGRTSAGSGTTTVPLGLSSNSTLGAHIKGTFVATATGLLRLMWAQNGSSAQPSRLLIGSSMEVRRVTA